ncbi:MAG: cupin domain-containing protein [Desulfovibrionaceae bacterium]|jgi:quercetin dioxygenase-like cupin family protein|nr:cupin domain-containing protein [Desulfovibrionaceae bacterium]
MTSLFDCFCDGKVACADRDLAARDLPWNPHPTFPGVALKHLVTGRDTDGSFSLHLVRLDPGKSIDAHTHAASWELHQVLEGRGSCRLGGRESAYGPGVGGVLPAGMEHSVQAGDEGLRLLAVFAPALL